MKRYGFFQPDDRDASQFRELPEHELGGYVLAADVPRWIPSASPPAYDVDVLVTDGKDIDLCSRDRTDSEGDHYEDRRNKEFTGVTHWMPLPELPK